LKTNTFYHIYNRGINGETLFKQERNFEYFLKKYDDYLSGVVDTYAYCLLDNHFHLLVRTKPESAIMEVYSQRKANNGNTSKTSSQPDPSAILSQSFASVFKSYAQAVNKAFGRTGALFEEPFRRIEITSSDYFIHLVHYIHFNPQKHGFVNDFRDNPHSAYTAYLSLKFSK